MSCTGDIRTNGVLDLTINRDRDLDQTFHAVMLSGTTEVDFDFATNGYTGATMEVKIRSTDVDPIITFSTVDGSLELKASGRFTLAKSASELLQKSGKYHYDMYVSSSTYPKRAFLSGDFNLVQNVTY